MNNVCIQHQARHLELGIMLLSAPRLQGAGLWCLGRLVGALKLRARPVFTPDQGRWGL